MANRKGQNRFGPAPGWPGGKRPPHRRPVLAGQGRPNVRPGRLDLSVPHSGPQDFEARLLTGRLHADDIEYGPSGTMTEIKARCLDPQNRRQTRRGLNLRLPGWFIGVLLLLVLVYAILFIAPPLE